MDLDGRIAARRRDSEFKRRLRRLLDDNREALERLAQYRKDIV